MARSSNPRDFWIDRGIEALAKNVGDWNALGGAIKPSWGEATNGCVESPITNYGNFEHPVAERREHLPAVLKVIADIERPR